MLEKCTNTSSPCSREMKPKPFSALKNLTVPCATTTRFSGRQTDQFGLFASDNTSRQYLAPSKAAKCHLGHCALTGRKMCLILPKLLHVGGRNHRVVSRYSSELVTFSRREPLVSGRLDHLQGWQDLHCVRDWQPDCHDPHGRPAVVLEVPQARHRYGVGLGETRPPHFSKCGGLVFS